MKDNDVLKKLKQIGLPLSQKEADYLAQFAKDCKPSLLSVAHVMGEFSTYILDCEVQRDLCYGVEDRRDVVRSLFNSVGIAPIHVSHDRATCRRTVIDGKNRLQSICDFWQGRIGVEVDEYEGELLVPTFAPLGKRTRYSFPDMVRQAETDARWQTLVSEFKSVQLDIRRWPKMPLKAMSMLFRKINRVKPQNVEEGIYCTAYCTKKLLRDVYDQCLAGLAKHVGMTTVRDNVRFVGMRWAHNICLLAFGPLLNGGHTLMDVGKEKVLKSAEEIHNRLDAADATGEWGERTFEVLGVKKNLTRMKRIAKALQAAIEYRNPAVTVKYDKNFIRYLMVFLLQMEEDGLITPAYIQHNIADVYAFIEEANQASGGHKGTHKNDHREKLAAMRAVWDRLGLNQNRLNQPLAVSAADRMAAPEKCPKCGRHLTDQNFNWDHAEVACVSSGTAKLPLCRYCNNQAGHNTVEDLLALAEVKDAARRNDSVRIFTIESRRPCLRHVKEKIPCLT